MMKPISIFLVLYNIITSIFPHEDYNYINYFNDINNAEFNIISYRYQEALSIYEDLFNKYPNIPYKDIHNAYLCAIETEDYKKSADFAILLIQRGYKIDDFNKISLNKLLKSPSGEYFYKHYDLITHQNHNNINPHIRDEILSLFTEDQQATKNENSRTQDSLLLNISSKLTLLIKNNRFPNLIQNKDSINLKLYTMLRHCCGLENKIKNFPELYSDSLFSKVLNNSIKPSIDSALRSGLLTPKMYEEIMTYRDIKNPFGSIAVKINLSKKSIEFFIKEKIEEVDKINKNRELVGLPPINKNSTIWLNSTWYKDYPFEEIEKLKHTCVSCKKNKDYIVEARKLEQIFMKEDIQTPFIISVVDNIHETYYDGLDIFY